MLFEIGLFFWGMEEGDAADRQRRGIRYLKWVNKIFIKINLC
jgi:hypothetical protein